MYTATLIAFLVGLTAGALGCFLLMSRSRAQSNIEQQLRELQEEFTAYRENVNTHFNKTAQMVNTLTENYLAVQKHLETAADSFAEPPKSFQLDTTQKLPNKKREKRTDTIPMRIQLVTRSTGASMEFATTSSCVITPSGITPSPSAIRVYSSSISI